MIGFDRALTTENPNKKTPGGFIEKKKYLAREKIKREGGRER